MGALGGLLGTAGGISGTGFSTPSGTNAGQINTAYNGAQNTLASQQDLLKAIQQQGGLQNQSNVYGQLQGVVSGQGPNPAQAMLAQATGQNVANQAALMAGQRGAAANPALLARQAAMQGANIQQQAAGQGASMQAQQSLNAMGLAGNLANTMAGNQINQTNQNSAAQQNEQGILQGANTANNVIQGSLANTQMQGQQGMIGGALNAAGAAAGIPGGGSFAEGGQVPGPANGPQSSFAKILSGYQTTPQQPAPEMATTGSGALNKGMTNFGKGIAQMLGPSQQGKATSAFNHNFAAPMEQMPASNDMPRAAGGGKVPAMVSPGEKFLRPNEVQAVAQGKVSPMQVGETIPGKAKVKGDSYANDTVPKKLEEGGVVLPRSVMNSKNPEKSAAAFVRQVIAKKRAAK